MASNNPWRTPRPYADNPTGKRPYSPSGSPSRNTRPRNPIHRDTLFEQGPLPLYAIFSSRGSRAIACFRNGSSRVWNVDPTSDRFLDCDHVLRHPETVFRAAIAEDAARAVTTAGDGVARIWDLQNRQSHPKEISSPYRSTRSCDISADGQFVSATFYTGKKQPMSQFRGLVVLYHVVTDQYLFRISVSGIPDKVKVARDATAIAVGCYGVKPARNMARDTRITIYNGAGNELRYFYNCFPSHDSCVSWDFSDDGHVLAICAQNRKVIEVYSDKEGHEWGDPPQELSINADLTYEMCRIVDNGDLISALVLDNTNNERSILVFRPRTGDVLFSVASGLPDQRACLDLEPRVCYAAPTYERPGRKVIRFLARTPAEISTLELIRCGDPPKNSVRGGATEFESAPPYVSLDYQSPLERTRDPLKSSEHLPLARMMEDSPAPQPPKPMDCSPMRGPSQLVRTDSLPRDDDMFTLTRSASKDRVDGGFTPLRTSAGLSPTKNASQMKPIPGTPELDMSMKEMQTSTKLVPSESKQNSESESSAPKLASKSSQACETAEKPTQAVLSPTSAVVISRELLRAKTEALLCKSTIASKSKLPTSLGPKQPVTPPDANVPSTSGLQQTKAQKARSASDTEAFFRNHVPTTESRSDAQALPDKQLTATEDNIEIKANQKKDLQTKTNEEIQDSNINEGKETIAKPIQQIKDTTLATNAAPVPNLKKPRWQPARLRARQKIAAEATLQSKAQDVTMPATGQEYIKRDDLGLSCQREDKTNQAAQLNARKGPSCVSNHSGSLENRGDRGIKGSHNRAHSVQRSQGIHGSAGLESSAPPGQQARNFSQGDANGEGQSSNSHTPILSIGNLVATYNKLVRTRESQARSVANSKAVGDPSPGGFKNEQIVNQLSGNHQLSSPVLNGCKERAVVNCTDYKYTPSGKEFNSILQTGANVGREKDGRSPHTTTEGRTTQEPTAKQETLFDHEIIKDSPKTVTSPNSTQVNPKEGSSTEAKLDPNEALCKNRYFEALERAKTMFRDASQKVQADQILSNVKAFKAMLEVIKAESELVDRRIVAKIVYEKGGINNTLDENLFLEAFSHLYQEMQAHRQRQWAEVYNQAAVEEGEGLLVFHARDLIKRESSTLKTGLNPIWNDETLDEVIASQTADGVLVDQAAFVRSTDKIFSI